jgi:hypothetical protein
LSVTEAMARSGPSLPMASPWAAEIDRVAQRGPSRRLGESYAPGSSSFLGLH